VHPRGSAQAGSLTQDQLSPFAARAEGKGKIVVTANTSPEVIAAKLNRSVRAIKARSYMIGLPLKWSKLKAKGK
jgi:hypothetical protein